jgi:hypothetical protein
MGTASGDLFWNSYIPARRGHHLAPEGPAQEPEISLAWPTYVAVSDRWAYVADTVNRRIVRVKLGYETEAACDVR